LKKKKEKNTEGSHWGNTFVIKREGGTTKKVKSPLKMRGRKGGGEKRGWGKGPLRRRNATRSKFF